MLERHRVLLIEDQAALADSIAQQMEERYGYEVTTLADPVDLPQLLRASRFDVAIVDLLFTHLTNAYNAKRSAGGLSLTRGPFLLSGLTPLVLLHQQSPQTKLILWTSGEDNRILHLQFAYEELGQRVFSSKASSTLTGPTGQLKQGTADTLDAALRAALHDEEFVDPTITPYLPVRGAATVAATFLTSESKRAVWRAVAAGYFGRDEIRRVTGYSTKYIGKLMLELRDDLHSFDQGLRIESVPSSQVLRFAEKNWEFFLDEAIHRLYP